MKLLFVLLSICIAALPAHAATTTFVFEGRVNFGDVDRANDFGFFDGATIGVIHVKLQMADPSVPANIRAGGSYPKMWERAQYDYLSLNVTIGNKSWVHNAGAAFGDYVEITDGITDGGDYTIADAIEVSGNSYKEMGDGYWVNWFKFSAGSVNTSSFGREHHEPAYSGIAVENLALFNQLENSGGGLYYSDQGQAHKWISFDDSMRLITPGVPEPSTWLMMIIGFGVTGVVVRRRRKTYSAFNL